MRDRISEELALEKTKEGEEVLKQYLDQIGLPYVKNDGLFLENRQCKWSSYDSFKGRVTYSVFYQDDIIEQDIGRLQVHLVVNKTFAKTENIKHGFMYFKLRNMAREIPARKADLIAYYTYQEKEMLFVPVRYINSYIDKLKTVSHEKINNNTAIRAYPLNTDITRHKVEGHVKKTPTVSSTTFVNSGSSIDVIHDNPYRITPEELINSLKHNNLKSTNKLKVKTMTRILGGKNVQEK